VIAIAGSPPTALLANGGYWVGTLLGCVVALGREEPVGLAPSESILMADRTAANSPAECFSDALLAKRVARKL